MLNVIWSDSAIADVSDNIDYLEIVFSDKEVSLFLNNIDNVLNILRLGNIIFISSGYIDVYKVPIVSQITLFYKIQNDTVFLLRFWNNRQNPENFNLR